MPQQRADPFPFATPRIPKSDGQRADPSSLSDPISSCKVPQHDVASYALSNKPNRQSTKHDLGPYDFKWLNAIEYLANSAPYLGNTVYRNDLILDNEVRTSNALICFFLDGEVAELLPGFNLLIDERAWERVPNALFFNSIRMAWNNFSQRATYNQEGSSSTSTMQRNADVGWYPTAFLYPEARLEMKFLHAEVLDIRARARQLQKLLNREDEGAAVDSWIENCSIHKEPSRLALERYLKRHWQRELQRQKALRQSKPAIANKWQPPGPELHEGNRLRCNKGPICYALDVISQWHK